MAGVPPGASWRDSARNAKLWIFDANAAFPLLIMFFHITWYTIAFALTAMLFFTVLSKYGITIPVFLRMIRSFLAGPRKIAIPWWFQ